MALTTFPGHGRCRHCAAHPVLTVGRAWLHLPTGTAGLATFSPHIDRGPIVHGSIRLLDALTPVPLPEGHPHAGRTDADVEAALHQHGWRIATLAEACAAVRAEGYLLGVSREPGHVLYADQDADTTTWSTTGRGWARETFAVPGALQN